MTGDFKGRRVTVMGLGLFGGGVGAVRFLLDRGARVLITDLRDEKTLAESVEKVKSPDVTFRLGEHRAEDFTGADLVVANPAVAPDNRYLADARRAGVEITSEMTLFFQHCRAPIIGITGSNGKSTTAALVAHILETAGRQVRFGGNIGRSLLPDVEDIADDEIVVLEISSFQLEYLHEARLSPHVAVVMNLQPNHLDRHKTMEAYAEAKRHIVEHQRGGDAAALNVDDAWVWPMRRATPAQVLAFSLEQPVEEGAWLEGKDVRCRFDGREGVISGLDRGELIGRHNRQNICAATAAALFCGIDPKTVEEAAIQFKPLPHRLQTIAVSSGVRYINDSIATNPDSVAAALACFEGNVILVAGGSPKDIPYGPMLRGVVEKVKLLLLIGQTAGEIEQAVRSAHAEKPQLLHCQTLENAVRTAVELAVPGDVVLLSPACASFDQFRNFAERGERFSSLVKQLTGA